MSSTSSSPLRTDRREEVSGECIEPLKEGEERKHIFVPKSREDREMLHCVLKKDPFFDTLDTGDMDTCLDAMDCEEVKAGHVLIRQGDENAGYFYVIQEGEFDCTIVDEDSSSRSVAVLRNGDVFGEMALLYNVPRMATVTSLSNGRVWKLDRLTFHEILLDNALAKRAKYEAALGRIPLLKPLTKYELLQVADACKPLEFAAGEYIIHEGDIGTCIYILLEGRAQASLTKDEQPIPVMNYGTGAYFGELALIMKTRRQATVSALTDCLVLALEIKIFNRILGPCKEILERNAALYTTAEGTMVNAEEDGVYYSDMFPEASDHIMTRQMRSISEHAARVEQMAVKLMTEARRVRGLMEDMSQDALKRLSASKRGNRFRIESPVAFGIDATATEDDEKTEATEDDDEKTE